MSLQGGNLRFHSSLYRLEPPTWRCLEIMNLNKIEWFWQRIHEPRRAVGHKNAWTPWVHDFKIQIFYSEMDPTGQLNFFIQPDFVSDIDFKCLVSQNQKTSVDSLLRIDFKKPNIFMPIHGYKPRTGNNCGYLINEWAENGLWSCDRHMNNCIFQCGLKSVVVSCQCQNIGPFTFLA